MSASLNSCGWIVSKVEYDNPAGIAAIDSIINLIDVGTLLQFDIYASQGLRHIIVP